MAKQITSESPGTRPEQSETRPRSRSDLPSVDDHLSIRLWLRLLTCSNLIEAQLGQRLRHTFGSSLPRFDLLSQLYRFPEGLQMKALSQRLMVTGGSITGLADQLEKDGLVKREMVAGDRRAKLLKLTPAGRDRFERMATEHEQWVIELFGHLSAPDQHALRDALGQLRAGLSNPR
jgi:DNA-binding MarR family transcriptional regulator